MRSDLHIHTTASDGRLSPAEVVKKAAELSLDSIAITDHDTVEGIKPALAEARRFPELLVIPGVEISTDIPRGEVHVLGYFINHQQDEFGEQLETLRNSRVIRGRKMVERLADLGIHIDWERVLSFAGGASIGRPHLAQAMLEQGHVSSLREAFDEYIGRNGPAYVEREKLTPLETVELITKAEGLPVLAHPANIEGLESFVRQLKGIGLIGIEVYYNGYSLGVIEQLDSLAKEYGLVPCGGSDFHGFNSDSGGEMGQVDVPSESVIQIITLAKQRKLGKIIN